MNRVSTVAAHVPGVNNGVGGLAVMLCVQLQYNMCIDTWSLRHLTSAEEYPDEEYLDMSKSSSLENRGDQNC